MKKQWLYLGIGLLMFGMTARAETCAGGAGTIVEGVGHGRYCAGVVGLNWWSAFAWCDAIGGTLVDATDDCACEECTTQGSASLCLNLPLKKSASGYWTRNENARDPGYAYDINPYFGNVNKTGVRSPLCRM